MCCMYTCACIKLYMHIYVHTELCCITVCMYLCNAVCICYIYINIRCISGSAILCCTMQYLYLYKLCV
jgi:hypothetical protein